MKKILHIILIVIIILCLPAILVFAFSFLLFSILLMPIFKLMYKKTEYYKRGIPYRLYGSTLSDNKIFKNNSEMNIEIIHKGKLIAHYFLDLGFYILYLYDLCLVLDSKQNVIFDEIDFHEYEGNKELEAEYSNKYIVNEEGLFLRPIEEISHSSCELLNIPIEKTYIYSFTKKHSDEKFNAAINDDKRFITDSKLINMIDEHNCNVRRKMINNICLQRSINEDTRLTHYENGYICRLSTRDYVYEIFIEGKKVFLKSFEKQLVGDELEHILSWHTDNSFKNNDDLFMRIDSFFDYLEEYDECLIQSKYSN